METNLQKCAISEKCKVNTLGRGWQVRPRAGERRCRQSPEGRGLPRRGGEGGIRKHRGRRKVAGLCPKRSLPPAHNRVAKSTRGDLADYLRGSTCCGPATPLRPCAPDRCGHSRPSDSVGSSAAAANNGLIDAGAQRLGARVPPPFTPWPPRTAGGPFP